jgi:hypothetical protein
VTCLTNRQLSCLDTSNIEIPLWVRLSLLLFCLLCFLLCYLFLGFLHIFSSFTTHVSTSVLNSFSGITCLHLDIHIRFKPNYSVFYKDVNGVRCFRMSPVCQMHWITHSALLFSTQFLSKGKWGQAPRARNAAGAKILQFHQQLPISYENPLSRLGYTCQRNDESRILMLEA